MSTNKAAAASQAIADKLGPVLATNLPIVVAPSASNPYLAKIQTLHGNICVYTNQAGKVTSIKTNEISNPENRIIVDSALAQINANQLSPAPPKIKTTADLVAYTDGSSQGGQCGWSAVVFDKNGESLGEYSGNLGPQSSQQIAGEVEGAIRAIDTGIQRNVKSIEIRHDYEGVGCWGRNEWKAKDADAIRMKLWAAHAKTLGIQLIFTWTKAHNGNPGNERADKLAGEATRLPVTFRIPNPGTINITPALATGIVATEEAHAKIVEDIAPNFQTRYQANGPVVTDNGNPIATTCGANSEANAKIIADALNDFTKKCSGMANAAFLMGGF